MRPVPLVVLVLCLLIKYLDIVYLTLTVTHSISLFGSIGAS